MFILFTALYASEKFYLSRDPMSPVTWLKSEVLYLSGNSCLEFWYYKPGHDSSELRVLLGDDDRTQIWSSLHTQGHTWRQVLIPLSNLEIPVKVFFLILVIAKSILRYLLALWKGIILYKFILYSINITLCLTVFILHLSFCKKNLKSIFKLQKYSCHCWFCLALCVVTV